MKRIIQNSSYLICFLLLVAIGRAQTLQLVNTIPIANQNGISRSAAITLNFNSSIDATTVNSSSIQVRGHQTGTISGVFTTSGSTVIFNPTNDFKPDEVIRITVGTKLKNLLGDTLNQYYQFDFRATSTSQATDTLIRHGIDSLYTVTYPMPVHTGDVDGDGDIDIVAGFWNQSGNTNVRWYENNGSGNFTMHVVGTTYNSIHDIYAVDMDDDGDEDILCGSFYGGVVLWYENDGNQNFTQHIIVSGVSSFQDVNYADFDGDGDIDVVSVSNDASIFNWYENDGNQNFTTHAISPHGSHPYSVYTADVDGDGDIDLVSTSENDNTLAWYENDGSGNFTMHSIDNTESFPAMAYPIDLDGDGDMDIVVDTYGSQKILWYENNGSQVFTKHVIVNGVVGLSKDVYACDIDGDGDMDIIAGIPYQNNITCYFNDGSQNFTTTVSAPMDISDIVDAADFDGDGDMDILASGEHKLNWYEFTILTPLAIDLKYFTASKYNQDKVLIKWETLSESYNSYFLVERSTDEAPEDFKTIAKVESRNGDAAFAQYYSTIDNAPYLGVNYYRLKTIDINGKATYSKAVAVNFNDNQGYLRVFPNPAKSRFSLTFNSAQKGIYKTILTNTLGQEVYQKKISAAKGMNTVNLKSNLPSGVYSIELIGNKIRLSTKLIISK